MGRTAKPRDHFYKVTDAPDGRTHEVTVTWESASIWSHWFDETVDRFATRAEAEAFVRGIYAQYRWN